MELVFLSRVGGHVPHKVVVILSRMSSGMLAERLVDNILNFGLPNFSFETPIAKLKVAVGHVSNLRIQSTAPPIRMQG